MFFYNFMFSVGCASVVILVVEMRRMWRQAKADKKKDQNTQSNLRIAKMEKARAFKVSHYDVTLPNWKAELLNNHACLMIYPYSGLNVSMGMASAYIAADSEDQITEEVREEFIRLCSDYGRENAEKVVPNLATLRRMWCSDFQNRQG